MSTQTNSPVAVERQGDIGVVTIDYPPVNALSQSVRAGLVDAIDSLNSDKQVKAIFIQCIGRTFIAGADIKEFGKPPTEPFLPDVVNKIEASEMPVVTAMFGTSLGGGFEVALACHYRLALASARVGLPEVNLGLIPGAGGTQRLPKIVGMAKALEMVTSGKHFATSQLGDSGLFDQVFSAEADLTQASIKWIQERLDANKLPARPVSQIQQADELIDWEATLNKVSRKARGQEAPVIAAKVMQQTQGMDIAAGMAIEREAFLERRESPQSAALRHAFAAERQVSKTGINAEPLKVETVGIIGGGNMGSGIATTFLLSGFKVRLLEQNQKALDAGVGRIESNFTANVKRGRMLPDQVESTMERLHAETDYQSLADCDLVIEAVFEDLAVKQSIFEKLDAICRPDCVLATNTSYLDINAIAGATSRPEQVIGMHFFSPAHIMKLLEVVRAEKSGDQAIATAFAVARRLKKIAVLVGVCFGFAGNRMYTRYGREIQQMLLEGAGIEQIDKVLTGWGMAMGPLAVQDLSGIDIGHNARSAQPFPEYDPGYFRAAAVMVENGRLGRKTGAGFYRYDGEGKAQVDPRASELIKAKAHELGVEQHEFSDQEILERAMLALISEGLQLFEEGIVQRLSDLDVIWLSGYGFPRFKGGPMHQAQTHGAQELTEKLADLRQRFGDAVWPHVDTRPLFEG